MKRFYVIFFLMLTCVLTSFDKSDTFVNHNDNFIVVLDAGHGGHDPGNLGNGYLEKNIALQIVLKVGSLLEQHPDIKVIYTRKDDTFVDLYVRGEIANKANADLFVSVHCDSHSSDAHGAGTFVLGLHANEQNFEIAKKENSVIYLEDNYETRYAEYDINSPESVIGLTIMQEEFLDQSIMLAKMMQDNFSQKLKRNDRKVKQAGFIVLHQTFMPSVLVETGFLTYKPEGGYLNSKKGQAEMGKAIADAIIDYKKSIRSNIPATQSPTEIVQATPPKKEPVVVEPLESKQIEANKEIVQGTNGNKKEEIKKPIETIKETAAEKKPEPPKEEEIAIVEKEIKKPREVEVKAPDPVTENPKIAEVVKKEAPEKNVLKAPKKMDEKETVAVTTENKKPAANIIFKVQLLASSKNMPLRAEDFKGLNKLSKEPYQNLYRYMYGNTNSYIEAKLLKSNADVKGYTTSYIVAYKDGERIPVPEALKYVSQ